MQYSINVRGRLLSLEKPVVMGILNLTPDSFYDGGQHTSITTALERAEKMLRDGATILDIGAQSTRAGAERISADDELKRLIPALRAITKEFPDAAVSVDTFYSAVASEAVAHGAAIINDVSAGNMDKNMFETVAKLKVPYVLMHMQGEPQTMQKNPVYEDVMAEIILFFSEKINHLRSLGVNDLILDPGFGFGKTQEHNYQILRCLKQLHLFELPILAGLSRKTMIQRVLDTDAAGSLNGTTAANMLALINGANILRVHDVREAVEACKIYAAYCGEVCVRKHDW